MNDDRERLAGLLHTMWRIRAFEDAAEAASQGGVSAYGKAADGSARVRGPLHLSTGQEAVAAGVCAHLRPEDRHRSGNGQQAQPSGKTPNHARARARTNSTNVPTGVPVGPLGIQPRSACEYAVPATSRWTKGKPSTNSWRKSAAVIATRPNEQ